MKWVTMINYRIVLILLLGIVMIVTHKRWAKELHKHYAPLFSGRKQSLKMMSGIVIACALVIVSFGVFLLVLDHSTASATIVTRSSVLFGLLSLCGAAYILWSIPGYYRWKKNKKGIELALFVTKLSIGILTFVGIAFGYVFGKF